MRVDTLKYIDNKPAGKKTPVGHTADLFFSSSPRGKGVSLQRDGLGKPVRSSRLVARIIQFLPRQSVVPRFLSERNV